MQMVEVSQPFCYVASKTITSAEVTGLYLSSVSDLDHSPAAGILIIQTASGLCESYRSTTLPFQSRQVAQSKFSL